MAKKLDNSNEELKAQFAAHGFDDMDDDDLEVAKDYEEEADDDADEDEQDEQEEELEEDSDDETEDESDDDSEPEEAKDEDEDSPKPGFKPKSKAELKIIDLKNRAKSSEKELRELREKLQAFESQKREAELESEYSQKYDEPTAKYMAKSQLANEKQAAKLELLEFKQDNFDVLARYPEAKENAAFILDKCKASNMTAEQICRGIYGEPEPASVRRAKESAVNGANSRKSDSDYAVSGARTKATTKATGKKTREQREIEQGLKELGFPD